MTTNACICGVRTLAWPPFPRQLRQRDYFERVIRHAAELDVIRQNIANNPAQWALDAENPRKNRRAPLPAGPAASRFSLRLA